MEKSANEHFIVSNTEAKLLEKWFKAEFTAPPIINERNGFSQAPAPPPILIILPLFLFKVGQNILDNLKADLNFKLKFTF